MKRVAVLLCMLGTFLMIPACSIQKNSTERLRDLEFTVVKEEDIPKELRDTIEERKQKTMKLTFADQGMLYIVEGYGEQATSGYSIEVAECFETENAIYFRSNLLGPSEDENIAEEATYPYIVVKMEYIDKNVVFQ